MHTDQIYIARDGKSGMHVLVRILAVDDIGKDYLPIDPDDFNKLMMARDVRSLVLAARDLGPMYISADILSRRIFIPSHLQQHIEHGVNLVPSDLESLLSVLSTFGCATNRAIATSYARVALASRNILLLALDRRLENVARHKDDLVIAYINQADSDTCNAHIDTENEPARFGRILFVRHQRRHDRLWPESEITWIAVLHHRPSLSFSLMIRWSNNTTSRSFLVFPTAADRIRCGKI